MTALHVVVRPRSEDPSQAELGPLHGVLDVIADGVNLTARVGEGQAIDFLTDLALAAASVVTCRRGRTTVALHASSEVWEVGLEADRSDVLLSVFSPGPVPSVAVYGRRVPFGTLQAALLSALDGCLHQNTPLPAPSRLGLLTARDAVAAVVTFSTPPIVRQGVVVTMQAGKLKLVAELELRATSQERAEGDQLERADLLALLGVGKLSVFDGRRRVVGGQSQVFLDAERLLALAECAFESFRSARPTFRRAEVAGTRVSLRRGPGEAALELRFGAQRGEQGALMRLPTEEFARVAGQFAAALSQEICAKDPEQRRNLRLRDFARRAAALMKASDGSAAEESVSNPSPASYSRFVPKLKRTVGIWETGPKMRFSPRWVASVPQIDLRATFLCGDLIMVGAANETACLRRRSGEVVWKRPTRPAASVVTPSGLVRVEPDGQLSCHQLQTGDVRFRLAVTPRAAGAAAGAVLHGGGMPKLLALVEGDRQVSGIDLLSGAVRWRHSARRPGSYRLRRAGRLLIFSGGDPLMVALDGVNGEVVWSLRARLPFSGDVAVDHDSAFTLSGVAGGRYRLHRFDPWSGEAAWEVELDERPLPGRAPLLTPTAVIVPTLETEGGGAIAFDRASGEKLWEHAPGLVNETSAWMAVDDCVLVNSASGMLLGLGAADGRARFQHVFSSSPEADQPRRLEPVLRSGALFVPQQQVHVVRPRDGELLGTLPSDLIPDMIRVDERCDVYVAEESGHLAAFGAAPRLALVRG